MRLHPAVATALVLVGGVLVGLPVYAWLRPAAAVTAAADPSPQLAVGFVSGVLGLVLVLAGALFSAEPRRE